MADIRIRVIVDPSGAVAGSQRASRAVEGVGQAADRAEQRVGGLMGRLRGLGGVLQVAAVLAAVGAYARVSDQVASMNAQLRLASRNSADLNKLQAASYAIAQKNGTDRAATGTLLAKTVKSARAMGLEWNRAAELGQNATAAISAGIRVSGTSAQAAQAGIFQLSQALASGTLRGDELNSVMENIPGVADALARAIGTTTGQLRKMGSAGQLASKMVIEGLGKAKPELERLAALIPLTFGAAFQKVQNAAAKLLTSMDQEGVGFGGALIASLDALSQVLDKVAANAQLVSRIIIGLLVAAAVKAAVAAGAAGAAALAQARANDAVAASAVRAATAQLAQARSSLAVTQAMVAQGAATAATARANAGAVVAAAAQVATARGAAAATAASVAAAAGRVGLLGRAFAAAGTAGRIAFGAIGGWVGVAIAALVTLLLWAGKAASGFKPIANEAGTVSDYVAVAFSDATDWVGKKFGELAERAKFKLRVISVVTRGVAVYIVDAFLGAARGAAGAIGGIVAAWRAGIDNIKGLLEGLKSDAASAMKGDFTTAGISGAYGKTANLGGAFSTGYGAASAGAYSGVTGESVIKAVEAMPGQAVAAISDWAKSSGLRGRANQRAKDRAAMANAGGDNGPGKPVDAADKGDKDKKKGAKDKEERTFQNILDEAKEQAKLASMTTNEAEKLSAVYSAQKDLKRDLTASEKSQLTSVIQQRQNNEANLRLQEQIRDASAATLAARVQSQAEDARASGNYGLAIQLEAELQVQQLLNQAKREGTTLDEAKVAAYRQAVLLAGRETEIIRLQEESRRALQQIADQARDSIRSAVSDGIYAALSGDIKGVKGLFKTLGNIFKRQLAETLTFKLFQGDQKAKVDNLRVTTQALTITEPAAKAVREAGMGLVEAINSVSSAVEQTTGGTLIGGDTSSVVSDWMGALKKATPEFDESLGNVIEVIRNRTGGLGGVLGGLIETIRGVFSKKGGLGKLFSQTGSKTSLGNLGKGAAIGTATGQLPGVFGLKTSSTGGMIGGALGQAIGGPLGAAIGGALGSIVGGLLKKAKTGTATIGNGSVVGGGNNAGMTKAAVGAGNSIMDQLKEAAKALGGGVGSFGNITIGQRDGAWRVNTTGTSTKKKKGATDFGEDAQAALDFAFKEAIKRGALTGLSEGVSAAIKSGAATIEEAVDFTNARKKIRLEALRLVDPVKAAVMEVDEEFQALRDQFKKFGEDTTDLEKVYLDRRTDAIKTAMQDQLGIIRTFIDDLKGGSIGGQSLSERAAFQNQLFSAIESAQASGKTINYDELNSVGRALLDATRELEGATPAFYEQVNRVMAVLNRAIVSGENPNVTSLPSTIFAPTEVTVPIVKAVNDNFDALLNYMALQNQALAGGAAAVIGSASSLTSAEISTPIVESVSSGFDALLNSMTLQSQAIVRGDAATVHELQDFKMSYVQDWNNFAVNEF